MLMYKNLQKWHKWLCTYLFTAPKDSYFIFKNSNRRVRKNRRRLHFAVFAAATGQCRGARNWIYFFHWWVTVCCGCRKHSQNYVEYAPSETSAKCQHGMVEDVKEQCLSPEECIRDNDSNFLQFL